MKYWIAPLAGLSLLAQAPALLAADTDPAVAKVETALKKLLPGVQPNSIRPAPVEGLYEVILGPRLIYVTADGRYLLQGSIIDLKTKQNVTEPRLAEAKAAAVEAVGEDNMLIFSPEKPAEHTITVFTDIDCGYCRKLHGEMDKYHEQGIEVRYLLYPRAGKGSPSYRKAVTVWCSEDRKQAMTEAKSGKVMEDLDCANPVDSHMMLGQLLGVSGTPAIVLESGEMIPGYVPADRLRTLLEQRKTTSN